MAIINIRIDDDSKARFELAARERGLAVSAWLKMLGTDEANRMGVELPKSSGPLPIESCVNEYGAYKKATTQLEREQLIGEGIKKGMTAKEICEWLNKHGYLAQRGEFTIESVRAICKRIKNKSVTL